jgi:ATP-dependent DNA ligase
MPWKSKNRRSFNALWKIGPRMNLMEAESVARLPRGAQWQYEPKWDGFRCLLIRDGSRISMQSKSGRDLVRYFPEVAAAAAALSPKELTLDGELLIQIDGGYSFDALLQRIHPAASRVKHLTEETPATFMVFDLLRSGNTDLSVLSLVKRRAALDKIAQRAFEVAGVFGLITSKPQLRRCRSLAQQRERRS